MKAANLSVPGQDVVIAASTWISAQGIQWETPLTGYHKTYPLRHGMPREELKSRLKLAPRLFSLIVPKMASEGVLTESPKWVALPGHVVRFSPFQQVKVDKLLKSSPRHRLRLLRLKNARRKLARTFLAPCWNPVILWLSPRRWSSAKEDYEAMLEKIHLALQKKGKITLAEVRDLLNTSRKYVQALLEHLDATGVTVREGDYRRLKRDQGQGNQA